MPSTIKIGSSGPDVVLCQESLTKHGIACKADGSFGPVTDKNVKTFQGMCGLTEDGVVGPATWSELLASPKSSKHISSASLPPVMKHAQSLGHKVWEEPYRMWLYGIRNPNRQANRFDDELGCAWVDNKGVWTVESWAATTDPGEYWLINPSKSSGTAILVEGQYLDTYKIDLHAGKYAALCQRAGEVSVYRDASRDNKLDLDPSTIATGYFGINLHAATQREGGTSTSVDKWSAGCQVHATAAGFKRMMELAHLQVSKTGRQTFTYTLMKKW